MALVTDLDLPLFDHTAPGFAADSYHAQLAEAHAAGWLARSPIAYIVLERESGEFFLRSRNAAFPGRQLADLFGITAGPLREHIDANILNQSGEQHRRLRALVGPAFTPRAAGRWRPAMRDFLLRLWDGLAPADSCEFVSAVAKPYPSMAIAAVLGAPTRDAPKLHEWSNWVQRQFDIRALEHQAGEIEQAVIELTGYVSELLERRRAEPSDDLISTLLAAEADGDRLSHTECVNLVANVLQGGVDTTQSQLAHALRLFAEHPGQWRLLGDDPRLAPRAVQEVLRFEPITPFTARICLADIEHRGVVFPAGTIVAICTERANREQRDAAAAGPGQSDAAAAGPGQSDAEVFDITAERDGRLLTFGAGVHFCLGANLATAELEEALAFLAVRMPGVALDGEPKLGGVEGIYGIEALPLRWTSSINPQAPDPRTPPGIDPSVSHPARVWNYWLGGNDYYAVDQKVGDRILAFVPELVRSARADRHFLARAVRFLTAQGIRQFLDIGTGLPTVDNTHEVAQRLAPESRVVYVDNDPLVLVHARSLLTSTAEGACDYIDADVHDPEAILRQAARTLDFSQPVAIMMLGVLNFVIDPGQAAQVVRQLTDATASGSYLVISHPTAEVDAVPMTEAVRYWNQQGSAQMTLRTREELLRLFDGLELLEPGVVTCSRWRPEVAEISEIIDVPQFGGMARKTG